LRRLALRNVHWTQLWAGPARHQLLLLHSWHEGTSHGPRGLPVMSASSVIGPMYERVVKKEVTALASPSYLWPEPGSTPPSSAPSYRRGTTGSKPSRAGRISGKT
jgi:hypothetical protein